MMILNIQQYFDRPTSIKIEEKTYGFTPPLITFCNHRHVSVLVLQELIDLIEKNEINNETCFTNTTGTKPEVLDFFQVIHYLKILEEFFNHAKYCNALDMSAYCHAVNVTVSKYPSLIDKFRVSREAIFSQLSKETLDKISENWDQLVMSCINVDETCNINYTTVFYDPYYYKCYTYDPKEGNKDFLESINEGIDRGITLVFFSGSKMIPALKIPGFDNTLKHTGGTDGVRVVIHPRGTRPNPQNQGVDAPSGPRSS